jgi:hypothetical protein
MVGKALSNWLRVHMDVVLNHRIRHGMERAAFRLK